MRQLGSLLGALALLLGAVGKSPFAGRWDLTVKTPSATYPAWVEVSDKDGQPEARIQPRGGSVRPAHEVKLEGNQLILTISPAAEDRPAFTWELNVKGGVLTGSVKRGQEVQGQIGGQRAPELKNKPSKNWTSPEALFNGKDLTWWEPGNPAENHWVVQNGELVNQQPGSNLRTTGKFDDFKLHLEFNCPDGVNSGIFLRGRYQVQIEYSSEGVNDKIHGMGSIFGYVAPSQDLPNKPGEWETMDITLLGRWVTVVRNGVTIIDNQEIPGITGGALDSNEDAPGPFNLQGTHAAGIRFRNLTISVPKR
ncbi:MAG: DUF1080 domain-containing protein [Bryobacteraceae bacterium]|jgi:hypothetical protein